MLGDVASDDRAQHFRLLPFWAGHYTVSLCGDGLVEQPDGEPCVAEWAASFGLG
jgi:hypothetical protein